MKLTAHFLAFFLVYVVYQATLLANVSNLNFYFLPQGKRIISDDVTYHAYTLEEFKILLNIYNDYKIYNQHVPILKANLAKADKIMGLKDQHMEYQSRQFEIIFAEKNRLYEKWKKENKLRHECENEPNFGSWISWSIAAAATVATTILSTILIIK